MGSRSETTPTDLSKRIDAAIREAGLTNRQVAERIATRSKEAVGTWRRGDAQPLYEEMRLLAETTGRSLYWLITGEKEPMGLKEMFEVFRAEVGSGAEPGEVWERLTGEPMSPDERAILAGQADELREYLRGPGGVRWAALDQDEQEAVSRLVELLGRNRSAASLENGHSAE